MKHTVSAAVLRWVTAQRDAQARRHEYQHVGSASQPPESCARGGP
ncbi:hypothetical protein [Corynebacterium casei]